MPLISIPRARSMTIGPRALAVAIIAASCLASSPAVADRDKARAIMRDALERHAALPLKARAATAATRPLPQDATGTEDEQTTPVEAAAVAMAKKHGVRVLEILRGMDRGRNSTRDTAKQRSASSKRGRPESVTDLVDKKTSKSRENRAKEKTKPHNTPPGQQRPPR